MYLIKLHLISNSFLNVKVYLEVVYLPYLLLNNLNYITLCYDVHLCLHIKNNCTHDYIIQGLKNVYLLYAL